jgi:hypothetical protein
MNGLYPKFSTEVLHEGSPQRFSTGFSKRTFVENHRREPPWRTFVENLR